MAKKKTQIPKYGTITLKGIQYYRTRITDADGKELSLYAATCEELYEKQLEARKQVEEIIFHRQHPTVAEYGEKWLLMQSAKVSASTLRGYTRDMTNYTLRNVLHLKAVSVRWKKVAVHGKLTKNTLGHGGLHGVKAENGI